MILPMVESPGALRLDCALLHLDVGGIRTAVGLRDHQLLLGVVDEDPTPLLIVRTGGRLGGDLHAFEQQLSGHRLVEIESFADRARGGQEAICLVEVELGHATSLSRCCIDGYCGS